MRLIAACLILLASMIAPAFAQSAPPPQAKIDQLLGLLQDPDIKAWLESRKTAPDAVEPDDAEPDITGWEASTRTRIDGVIAAIPRIPAEVAAASARTSQDALTHGYAPVFAIIAGLIAIGTAAEWLYGRSRKGTASASSRFLSIAIFAAAMAIIFFALQWPPLARIVILLYLSALIIYRIISTITGLAALSPPARMRIRLFAGILVFAIATSWLGKPLGVDPSVTAAISYSFSVILLIAAAEGIWSASGWTTRMKLASVTLAAGLWVLWCLGLRGIFWLGIYAFLLPGILRATGRAAAAAFPSEPNSMRHILTVRGSRALVVVAAVAWLALVWRLNPNSLAHQDPAVTAIAYGLLKSVIILLIADLVWHLSRAWIDRTLAATPEGAVLSPAETARRGRIRTLLPIFRNALAVIVAVMAALIVLSQLGVQIAPLIAGAGIFGVALGFGSQTLVKDVISGVFYMLDDAFRVGEYIQAKNYKGTVEGFSLRSVRLRHHRGPVFTVPFGELGAVENMSRDWVIDKFRISVGYDTDINKARKIAKAIGAELQADAEVGPLFLEPLKMKGVEEFGDYGIVLSFAMTTVPGQQTYIRRKAYAMIREAFKANGIEFATPSVQVGGDDKGGAAAATAMMSAKAKTDAAGG